MSWIDRPHRSSRRHADLEAFGADRLELARVGVLEIEPVAHRADRRHPAKHLERHLHDLLRLGHQHRFEHDLARRLFGARERAAEHHRVAAEEQRLRDAAVAADAAVGDERHAIARPPGGTRTSASTCGTPKFVVMPRRAAAAWADADLDAVDAALEQEPRALGRADVAGDRARRRRNACAPARSRAP